MTSRQVLTVDLDNEHVRTSVEKFPPKGGRPEFTTFHYYLRFGSFELELVSGDLSVIEEAFAPADKDVACLRSQQPRVGGPFVREGQAS